MKRSCALITDCKFISVWLMRMFPHLLSKLYLHILRLSKTQTCEIYQSISLTAERVRSGQTRTSSWSAVLVPSVFIFISHSTSSSCHCLFFIFLCFPRSMHTHSIIFLLSWMCNSFDTSFSPLLCPFIFASSLAVQPLLSSTHTHTSLYVSLPHSLRPWGSCGRWVRRSTCVTSWPCSRRTMTRRRRRKRRGRWRNLRHCQVTPIHKHRHKSSQFSLSAAGSRSRSPSVTQQTHIISRPSVPAESNRDNRAQSSRRDLIIKHLYSSGCLLCWCVLWAMRPCEGFCQAFSHCWCSLGVFQLVMHWFWSLGPWLYISRLMTVFVVLEKQSCTYISPLSCQQRRGLRRQRGLTLMPLQRRALIASLHQTQRRVKKKRASGRVRRYIITSSVHCCSKTLCFIMEVL